jgi:hypothetical protein
MLINPLSSLRTYTRKTKISKKYVMIYNHKENPEVCIYKQCSTSSIVRTKRCVFNSPHVNDVRFQLLRDVIINNIISWNFTQCIPVKVYWRFGGTHFLGCATSQAVSRWFPSAVHRVRAQVWSSRICGGQSGAGIDFLWVLRFPLPIFIPPNSPSSKSPGAG